MTAQRFDYQQSARFEIQMKAAPAMFAAACELG